MEYLRSANQSVLIENAVRKLSDKHTTRSDKGLEELTKSAGKNALVNLYLKIPSHCPYWTTIFSSKI
jgi:hypothetical protein